MPIARTCSECSKSLAGYAPQAKTCGQKCRQERSRRVRSLTQSAARESKQRISAAPAIREVMLAVRDESSDAVKEVVKEQLAPIVRDALTEDVLRSIKDLMGLSGTAVAALKEDLESEDAVIRQRAYALQMKYTMGHPALVKPEDSAAGGQMVVNFNLPRPDSIEADAEDVDTMELRVCDLCSVEKPEADFVGDSDRCQACVDEWKQRITAQFD